MVLDFGITGRYDTKMSKDPLSSRARRKTVASLGGWATETSVNPEYPCEEDTGYRESLWKDT